MIQTPRSHTFSRSFFRFSPFPLFPTTRFYSTAALKISSWNINGLNSVVSKGVLQEYVKQEEPDIMCFQETKLSLERKPQFEGKLFEGLYPHEFYHCALKKGYSGNAIFSKVEPKYSNIGINQTAHDTEGRSITLEFEDFFLVSVYVPNSQSMLKRLSYRRIWNRALSDYLHSLQSKKPLIVCGDLNVAHTEMDIHDPVANQGASGFSEEEREDHSYWLLGRLNLKDVWRELNPQTVQYTWWSYRSRARARNKGWRIDYFLMSEELMPRVKDISINHTFLGSDHCPLELVIEK